MRKVESYLIVAEEYERLVEIEKKLDVLKTLIEKNDPVFITVAMIANAEGLKRQDVLNRPWLMPNFGRVTNMKEGKRKRYWHFEDYLDWVSIPEQERIKMYQNSKNIH